MASPRPVRIRFLAAICLAACAVSAGVGWLTGTVGTYLYGIDSVSRSFSDVIPARVGGWVGACSAVIACIVWCRVVVPMSLHRVLGLRSTGGLAGLGAGALAALLLHVSLMTAEGQFRMNALAVGLGMGAPIGLVLGVIGGHLCRIAVTTERAFRLPHERRIVPYCGPTAEPDFMEQLDVRVQADLRGGPTPRSEFRDEYDA